MTMFTKVIAMLAISSAACSQVYASILLPPPLSLKKTHINVPSDTDMVANLADIKAAPLAPLNITKDYVSFITPLTGNYEPTPPQRQYARKSDEYWLSTTGRELNQGVELSFTQGDSLIRLAPRGYNAESLFYPEPISTQQVHLERVPKPEETHIVTLDTLATATPLISSMVLPDELATAGLADNASALQLSAAAKPGIYRLTVSQPLPPEAQYLINVKETSTPFQLTINTPMHVTANANTIKFALNLSQSTNNFIPTVLLKQAGGQTIPLAVIKQDQHWLAMIPDNIPISTSNAGLSELQIQVSTYIQGQFVRRNIKSAFKSYVDSAALQPNVQIKWENGLPISADFNIAIAQAGRFNLNAVLTGTDNQGNKVMILRTQAAKWLNSKSNKLSLKLDPKLIQQSQLTAPFELHDLTLQDQSQMALLNYQQDAIVLNR